MRKKLLSFFLLFGLMCGCAPTAPSASPTAVATSVFSPTTAQTIEPSPTLAQANLIEPITQLGGSIHGIVVDGDLAYVGMGPRVAVIDLSDHAAPHLLRQSQMLPGMVTRLVLLAHSPDPLLLASAGRYLVLLDASDSAGPTSLRQLKLAGAISALVWDESSNTIYVGGSIYRQPERYLGFIDSVSLTPTNDLILFDSVPMPERPLSLALGEGSLFAGAGGYQGGLYRLKVGIPGDMATPHLVIASTPESPLQPSSLQVVRETLYLGYRALEAYDITDPDRPVQRWEKVSGNANVIDDFTFVGGQVYFFGWTILNEYVRGVFTAPEPIGGSPQGESASSVAMHDGDFLVAYNDLEIFTTTDPSDLALLGSYQSPLTTAYAAVSNGSTLYALDLGAADGQSPAVLRSFSLPDLQPLASVAAEISNNPTWYRAPYLTLESDRLYLASLKGIWVYDISHDSPVLLGQASIPAGQIDAIAATNQDGRRLLAIAQQSADHASELRVLDLTDLQNTLVIGDPLRLDLGSALQISWSGAELYVLLDTSYHAHNDRLFVATFENDALTLKASLDLPEYTQQMAGDDRLILLGDLGDQLSQATISLVQPEPLMLLARLPLPEVPTGVAIRGDKAYMVVGDEFGAAQLLAFDVQNPSSPVLLQSLNLPVSDIAYVSVLVSGANVVVANGAGGLEIFQAGDR